MKPNANQLALRDPALAALLGALPSDFGHDSVGAADGANFGGGFGGGFGYDEMGADPDPTVAPPPPMPQGMTVPRPTASAMMNLWQSHHATQAYTQQRAQLLDPNANSTINVERYSFVLNQIVVLGTPVVLNMSGAPDFKLRPQRVTMNAPTPGFCTIAEIKVANVSVTSGASDDAVNYSAIGVGQHMDMPTLSPQNKATVLGNYTGFAPAPFAGGASFTFVVAFKGPSRMVA
jgi:hypothetical protein